MSLRGEITIECDVKGCHAEEVIAANALAGEPIDGLLMDYGWRVKEDVSPWLFTCPQCVEEGKQP